MEQTPQVDWRRLQEIHGIGEREITAVGLSRGAVEEIHADYMGIRDRLLDEVAEPAAATLQRDSSVHSVKVRVKDPLRLIEKILRKRARNPSREITVENYREQITDLIGIRALHLFKNRWGWIHRLIGKTWPLRETPIAYVRDGDPRDLTDEFANAGCRVEVHPKGYRSVHYVIESRLGAETHLAEIQVRTIFEEGWSEIDHCIRYRKEADSEIGEFLNMFNTIAGFADEMGTFLSNLERVLAERHSALETIESMIANNAKNDAERTQLRRELERLRSSGSLTSLRSTGGLAFPAAAPTRRFDEE
jgi:putative GTP pyrophosphokinase